MQAVVYIKLQGYLNSQQRLTNSLYKQRKKTPSLQVNQRKKEEEDKNGKAKEKDRTLFTSFSYSTHLGAAALQGAARIHRRSRAGWGRQGDI